MRATMSNRKKIFFFLFVLMFMQSCKQSEFYEKEGLSEIITTPEPGVVSPDGDPTIDLDPNAPDIIETPTDGGTSGGVITTPPPVISNPSTPTDPSIILNNRSEVFTQKGTTKVGDVDILWVVDDSGSMADEQEALGRNFQNFINQFIARNIDFKMAITSTDGTSFRNGKMIGDSAKLTSASAQGNRTAFINNFTKWIKVGTAGSGIEQGLKCASGFLDRYGASFLRDDAYFIVVFVSDEEDQSEKKVQDYLAKLRSFKTNPGFVKAYSIVNTTTPTNQWETVGTRYMSISTETSGTISSIKEEFSTVLKDMGGSIVELVDKFALKEVPYQNRIEVYVNNVKLESGWVFEPTQKTVEFIGNAIPKDGSQIEVRYQVQATALGAI